MFFSRNLGSSFFNWEFIDFSLKENPIDEEFCNFFVELSNCIMKKVIYYRGSPKQRVLIKGHFLFAAKFWRNAITSQVCCNYMRPNQSFS